MHTQKIIPGAIYLDKNGNRVTVKELMFDRVYFIRDGYSFHSSLNVEIFISRFRREIPPSRNNHVPCMDVDKKTTGTEKHDCRVERAEMKKSAKFKTPAT